MCHIPSTGQDSHEAMSYAQREYSQKYREYNQDPTLKITQASLVKLLRIKQWARSLRNSWLQCSGWLPVWKSGWVRGSFALYCLILMCYLNLFPEAGSGNKAVSPTSGPSMFMPSVFQAPFARVRLAPLTLWQRRKRTKQPQSKALQPWKQKVSCF